jgi:hypothetical protein
VLPLNWKVASPPAPCEDPNRALGDNGPVGYETAKQRKEKARQQKIMDKMLKNEKLNAKITKSVIRES